MLSEDAFIDKAREVAYALRSEILQAQKTPLP